VNAGTLEFCGAAVGSMQFTTPSHLPCSSAGSYATLEPDDSVGATAIAIVRARPLSATPVAFRSYLRHLRQQAVVIRSVSIFSASAM
jgi:hypothetical protein